MQRHVAREREYLYEYRVMRVGADEFIELHAAHGSAVALAD